MVVLQHLFSFVGGFDPRRMASAEVAQILPSRQFSATDKAKNPSSMYASIPREYAESLPVIADAYFGAM